jgi:hypothetical protein
MPSHNTTICASDQLKSPFYTRYRYYKYIVLLFRMANTAVLFQNMINEIFKNKIDLDSIAYINNILIYNQTKKEDEKLSNEILSRL